MSHLFIGNQYTFQISDIYSCTYQLSRDNGSTWTTIAANVQATVTNPGADDETVTNSYTWTITGPAATQCKIKSIDNEDGYETHRKCV